MAPRPRYFECHLYISGRDRFVSRLPREHGPRRLVTFAPIEQERLTDPGFRRLLVTLEVLTQTAGVA